MTGRHRASTAAGLAALAPVRVAGEDLAHDGDPVAVALTARQAGRTVLVVRRRGGDARVAVVVTAVPPGPSAAAPTGTETPLAPLPRRSRRSGA